MTYGEFLREAQKINPDAAPTVEEYKTIEYVYTWHPAISETKGKQQIAMLYVEFGMSLIHDMVPRANEMKTTEEHYRTLNNQLCELQKKMEDLRSGKIS